MTGGNVKSAERYRRNFVCARSEASTQQNSEKPPFDRHAGRARVCIGHAANMLSLINEGKNAVTGNPSGRHAEKPRQRQRFGVARSTVFAHGQS